jgi:hypothetical protein
MIAFKTATEADVPEPILDLTENRKLRRMEVAAPLMLKALERIRKRATSNSNDDLAECKRQMLHIESIARTAIAEAEGRDE